MSSFWHTLKVTCSHSALQCGQTRASPVTNSTAQLIIPFTAANDQVAEDWYQVELAQGTATVSVSSAPAGARFIICRVNSLGAATQVGITAAGAGGDFPFSVAAAGTYYIYFAGYAGTIGAFAGGAEPAHMKDSYSFQVQQ